MVNTADTITSSGTWFQMSVALAFVIGLVFVSAWLFKKISSGNVFNGNALNDGIRVLNRTAIGDKRFLVVISVDEKIMLLGMTPQSINLICELPHYSVRDQRKETLFERFFQTALKKRESGKK